MSKISMKIKANSSTEKSPWLENAKKRSKNKSWTKRSFKIAVKILREIRKQNKINGMTKHRLAVEIGVSDQYINKIVKGKVNLTLEMISKIETILGIVLIDVT